MKATSDWKWCLSGERLFAESDSDADSAQGDGAYKKSVYQVLTTKSQ